VGIPTKASAVPEGSRTPFRKTQEGFNFTVDEAPGAACGPASFKKQHAPQDQNYGWETAFHSIENRPKNG
jgi:hypothetical protein